MICPFCRKKEKEKLFSTPLVYACYDAYPVAKGHALVVTARHVPDFFRATAEERRAVSEALVQLKKRLDRKFGPQGYNIGMNCGEAAGQAVDHLHVHVIPRYAGDTPDPLGGVRGVIPEKRLHPLAGKALDKGMECVTGLDWAAGRWAAVALTLNRHHRVEWIETDAILPGAAAAHPLLRQSSKIVIDAPIGSAQNEAGTGDRPCDKGARKHLSLEFKPAVFAPPRPDQLDFVKKNDTRPRDMSNHVFGLCRSILSAGRIFETFPNVLESHPEVAFKLLNGDRDLAYKKDTAEGRKERGQVLSRALGKIGPVKTLQKHPLVRSQDLYDAMAMALVARAWAIHGERLAVIRESRGNPQKLGKKRDCIIALPVSVRSYRDMPSLFKPE